MSQFTVFIKLYEKMMTLYYLVDSMADIVHADFIHTIFIHTLFNTCLTVTQCSSNVVTTQYALFGQNDI